MKVCLYGVDDSIIECFDGDIKTIIQSVDKWLYENHSKYGNFAASIKLIGFEKVSEMIYNGGLKIRIGGVLKYTLRGNMGGNALKNTHNLDSKRMNLEEYEHVKEWVTNFLDDLGITYSHTKFYHTKTDFGDIDVVVSRGNDAVDKIRTNLLLAEMPMTSQMTMAENTDFLSTLYNEHQIDFIFVEPEQLLSASTYYSYNDIWNLLGKVIKTHEYKLGWQGLLYTYRDGNHYKKDIVLTYDLMEALEIMGLSVERYKQGFETHKDMFDYVISSKAFDASKFELKNLNHRNRVRDRKRKTYNMFLEYIDNKDFPEPIALEHPVNVYPHLQGIIDEMDNKFKDKKRAKEIINGNVICALTGLKNVDVKNVLETIRNRHTVDDILKFNPDDVRRIVLDTCNELGKQIK